MKRIRICQLITELGPAGAERVVYELATRLDREKFDVQVVALRGGAVADWLTQAGVKVTLLNVRNKANFFKLFRLAGLFRREKFDIIHTHLFHADLVAQLSAKFAGKQKFIHTVHIAEKRYRPWQFAWYHHAGKRTEKIIAVSQDASLHHASMSRLPMEKYIVIPNGVDVDAYSRNNSARAILRSDWGISDEEVLPVFLGRLDHQKGLDVLLESLKLLHKRGISQPIVIAGDGPERAMLEKFIREEPAGANVRYLGFRRDVREILSAADMLVMPSRWEGLPVTALEALAAGLPIIGTDAPGLREVMLNNNEVGLLISSEDAPALAEAMCRLIEDENLRVTMGAAGLVRVRENFSIEQTITEHEKLYENIFLQGLQ